MSKGTIYVIYDAKTKFYFEPIVLRNDEQATRVMMQTVANNEAIRNFASDYVLFKLGTFDNLTGVIDYSGTPEMVITAVNALSLAEKSGLLANIDIEKARADIKLVENIEKEAKA